MRELPKRGVMRDSTSNNYSRGMRRRGRRGILLLEAVLALAIAGILLVSIMWIVDGALQMSNEMADDGREHMTQEALINFLDRNFSQLPGNAEVELERQDAGSHFLSDLTFQNVPTSFSWSGQAISAEAVQLSTIPTRSGDLDVVLRYYEEAILDDSDSTANVNAEPVAEITLLKDVFFFEWWARDGRALGDDAQGYTETWDVRGRLPIQMELRVKFDENSDEIVHHFWLPPKLNPESVVRSQRRAAPQSGGGNSGRNPSGRDAGRGREGGDRRDSRGSSRGSDRGAPTRSTPPSRGSGSRAAPPNPGGSGR
ncbi:MAG: hypothetical protein P8M65_05825 [Roseibacillus sp.]|nr:hypothetical protein [Roseibacillus sp.]